MTITKYNNINNKKYSADKLGIVSSFLCIIHCLTTPLLLAMGVSFLHHPVIAFLFIFIAFISIYKATKRKFFSDLSLLLWIAFTGFFVSILLEERSVIFQYMMHIFSIAIIVGHFYNIRIIKNNKL